MLDLKDLRSEGKSQRSIPSDTAREVNSFLRKASWAFPREEAGPLTGSWVPSQLKQDPTPHSWDWNWWRGEEAREGRDRVPKWLSIFIFKWMQGKRHKWLIRLINSHSNSLPPNCHYSPCFQCALKKVRSCLQLLTVSGKVCKCSDRMYRQVPSAADGANCPAKCPFPLVYIITKVGNCMQ